MTSIFSLITLSLIISVCVVCVCVCAHASVPLYVCESQNNAQELALSFHLVEAGSLFLPSGSQETNLNNQAWQQLLSPTELRHHSSVGFFI